MIELARAGKPPFPRTFDRIIYTGASFEAIVGKILNINHPEDVDATIYAGFSKVWVNAVPGFVLTAELLSAVEVEPERYGSSPVAYLEADSESGVAILLFYGPGECYDETFIASDYRKRGTISVGEGMRIAEHLLAEVETTIPCATIFFYRHDADIGFFRCDGCIGNRHSHRVQGFGTCHHGSTGCSFLWDHRFGNFWTWKLWKWPFKHLRADKYLYPAAQNFTAIHVENSWTCLDASV